MACSPSSTTIAATLSVVASLRYEQALPMALDDDDGAALLALALRVLLVAIGISVPLAWALHAGGWLPLRCCCPWHWRVRGWLQVLMLWANRARRFRALAISRVLQYGGGALFAVLAGLLLWQGAHPAGWRAPGRWWRRLWWRNGWPWRACCGLRPGRAGATCWRRPARRCGRA